MSSSPSGRISLPAGSGTLLECLRLMGYHLRADCGGEGQCGKCRVRFLSLPPSPDSIEQQWLAAEELRGGWRLACRHRPPEPAVLEYGDDWQVRFRPEPISSISARRRLGLAVDIGTTGLVAALVNLDGGDPVLIARGFNPQRAWGADVMTRLVAARDPQTLSQLQQAILQAIEAAFSTLHKPIPAAKLYRDLILAVGNTAMIHLAAGIPETTLSVSPFRSPLEGQPILPLPLGENSFRLAGPIQGYVGSDHLAVLEFLAPHRNNLGPTLIMDLGTNSEIALWDGKTYWVTSCAAGPAFEGGGISCGAPAAPGVATGIARNDQSWRLLPPAKEPKTGLCGSALISLLGQLVCSGKMRRDGKLRSGSEEVLQSCHPRLALTQKDVRALQLAKGAIHTGIVMLSRRAGLALKDVAKVVITGAFARDLNEQDLKEIGLVPADTKEVSFINDGALQGAAKALSKQGEPFAELRPLIRVINLVEEPDFQEEFLEGLELKPRAE